MNDQGCESFVADCQVRASVELIKHTWDPVVIAALRMGPTRRSLLLERIAGASDKAVTESLRRLVARGLVSGGSRPPLGSALYELTPLGASFAEGPLMHLAEWAAQHQAQLASVS